MNRQGWIYFLLMSHLALGQTWVAEFPSVGTFSSPRVSDLNGDGIGDIILGAGRAEFEATDTAVVAIDGADGSTLWTVGASDQIFGTASMTDLDRDGIEDVIIGGRSAELLAIAGKTGEVIWRFSDLEDRSDPNDGRWYNFYNAQAVPDQNQDNIPDLLVSNGGDVLVEPYDPNRPAGKLALLCGATGSLISSSPMPDGKETYMSVAVKDEDGDVDILFGTGGETIGGSFYVGNLEMVKSGDLTQAKILCSSAHKGYIAPPLWIDLTDDGLLDILSLAVDGWVRAFEGTTYELLWEVLLPDTEAYSSLVPGYFNEDDTPDVFCSVAEGEWPKLEWNRQFLIDGASGIILRADSLGFYQTSSPIAGDLTSDGKDEILLSVNYQVIDSFELKYFRNVLSALNLDLPEAIQILAPRRGSNISSTPWMGDLDGDNRLDIIYVHGTNEKQTYTFDGMQIMRLSTDILVDGALSWPEYMGPGGKGVFRR